MSLPSDVLGVAPWIIITAIVSWFGSILANRKKAQEKADEQADRLEVHRDDLTFLLISSAKSEMASARAEVEDLREETRKLRAMENHFYHFQQALDHLEALLLADTVEAREAAERNARAFLNRMRRLNDAKGTVSNEVQRVVSEVALLDRDNKLGKENPDAKPGT